MCPELSPQYTVCWWLQMFSRLTSSCCWACRLRFWPLLSEEWSLVRRCRADRCSPAPAAVWRGHRTPCAPAQITHHYQHIHTLTRYLTLAKAHLNLHFFRSKGVDVPVVTRSSTRWCCWLTHAATAFTRLGRSEK